MSGHTRLLHTRTLGPRRPLPGPVPPAKRQVLASYLTCISANAFGSSAPGPNSVNQPRKTSNSGRRCCCPGGLGTWGLTGTSLGWARVSPNVLKYALLLSVKNLHAVQESRVRSLGWEDPLEKGMTTHSSILAWKISWTEEPGGACSPWGRKESGTTGRLILTYCWRHCVLFGQRNYFQPQVE